MVKHVGVKSFSDIKVQFRPGSSYDVVVACGGEGTW